MSATFFFYDLETSGLNPREARIMQFAGQRTDESLRPIGEPVNSLITLTPDVLPEPEAILLTGITPQQTLREGLSEFEFLRYFHAEIARPQTIFLGYNSVRFDDEFMRFLNYRNFYDAYEWQWHDNCSRWDMLDVVRMCRALRPDGVLWPFDSEGKPTNRLELLSQLNHLDHTKAHDALSDVNATIAIARLIKSAQPKLFEHLLSIRHKDQVRQIVDSGLPFMYCSGHFPSRYLHTTAAVLLAQSKKDSAIVYDLRFDPTPYLALDPAQLAQRWRFKRDAPEERLPAKTLKFNRCPAIAPGIVQDEPSLERLQLDMSSVKRNYELIRAHRTEFGTKLTQAADILDQERNQEQAAKSSVSNADARLYEAFCGPHDKSLLAKIRVGQPDELVKLGLKLQDERFKELLPLYKARNFPKSLNSEERTAWETHCSEALLAGGQQSRLQRYLMHLEELAGAKDLSENKRFLLEELRLYGESIVPVDVID